MSSSEGVKLIKGTVKIKRCTLTPALKIAMRKGTYSPCFSNTITKDSDDIFYMSGKSKTIKGFTVSREFRIIIIIII